MAHYILIDGYHLFRVASNRHNSNYPEKYVSLSKSSFDNDTCKFTDFYGVYKTLIPNYSDSSFTLNVDFSEYLLKKIKTFSLRNGILNPVGLVWDGAFSKGIDKTLSSPRVKEFKTTFDIKYKQTYKSESTKANVTLAKSLANNCNVFSYAFEGYETYDTMYSLVNYLLSLDENNTIDIFTDSRIMLPLVKRRLNADGTYTNLVTVYLKTSRASQGATDKPLYEGYWAITPDTWSNYLGYLDYFKRSSKGSVTTELPLNSAFLFSLIYGDTTVYDIPALYSLPYYQGVKPRKTFGLTKYNKLIADLRNDGVDFEHDFIYGSDIDKIVEHLRPYFSESDLQLISKMAKLRHPKQIPMRTSETGVAEVFKTPMPMSLRSLQLLAKMFLLKI